ncbi:MAG: leucyl aminopeptidase family protein [Pseudomonadota bacterium]
MLSCFAADTPDALPIHLVGTGDLTSWLDAQPARLSTWVKDMGFDAKAGAWCGLPGIQGGLEGVVAGLGETPNVWTTGSLAHALPPGDYRLAPAPSQGASFYLGWALGAYRFARYRQAPRDAARLVLPEADAIDRAERIAEAVWMARDLINTPAEDMGPGDVAAAAADMAAVFNATFRVIEGDALLDANYPAIHAVGRASSRPPRLIDVTWGRAGAPAVTLVGKGVCIDTGGLNLKTAAGMLRMKKDMGGAAAVLAVARMVMGEGLDVHLRVLIPAVDNAVDGNAYRPMDVIRTRKGTAIEIGDTDAEGRVILADALAAASEETPDLVIDMATLTGAARVALGPDLPALFANDETISDGIIDLSHEIGDGMWPIPIWGDYREKMASSIADTNTIAGWPFADHIQAALFLETFVGTEVPWLHIDTLCWNLSDRPGRPKGADVQGARAVFEFLCRRYGGSS